MSRKNHQPFFSQSLRLALLFPLFFLLIMWLVKIVEVGMEHDLSYYGLRPRTWSGLVGILTIPWLHGDWSHLFHNSISLVVFATTLFFFYRNIALKVWLIIYASSGALLWIIGRTGTNHIGMSAIIYGLGFFLFMGGVWQKNQRLAAISLILTAFYGGMIWGVLPLEQGVSWEGHLSGAIVGIILAYVYKDSKLGIEHYYEEKKADIPDIIGDAWKLENQDSTDFIIPQNETPTTSRTIIFQYHFKPNQQEEKD